jgi:radical SAM protein with 4Fe4S-binding SPASM domain
MQVQSSAYIHGKLGNTSSFVVYYPNTNVYEIANDLPGISFDFGDKYQHLIWKLFKLSRTLQIYNETFETDRNYTLFIEPYGTCNLKCSYCYEKDSWFNKNKLEYDRIVEVIGLYKVKDIRIFGGEPFLDEQMILRLFKEYPDMEYHVSSNGIPITERIVEALNEVQCNLQLSLEPEEWKQRVNYVETTQMELLEPKWKIIRKYRGRLSVRVTIPCDMDIPYVSFIDFVDRIAEKKGDYNFSLSLWPSAGQKLPVWFDKVLEEGQIILDDPELRKKMYDKFVWTSYISRFKEFTRFPWYMANCNAGSSSISLAPSGMLYGCHEDAVIENEASLIGAKTVDPDKQFKVISEYIRAANTKKECPTCDARYMCGGICYTKEIDSACDYSRKIMPLLMRWMPLAVSRQLPSWEGKTKEFETFIKMNMTELDLFFQEEVWNQYCCGELPKEKVLELGKVLQSLLSQKTS